MERAACVCRELTKTFEEFNRGPLATLAEAYADRAVKGEIVLVVAGAPETAASPETALDEVLARVGAGERMKDATRAVAEATGLSAKELYAAALTAKTGVR